MRVKAFSLIELIVVILLLGIIYFLVVSSYTHKKNNEEKLSTKDMPKFMKKITSEQSSIFYLYGQECEKSIIILEDETTKKSPNFLLTDKYKMFTCKPDSEFEEFISYSQKISKKKEHICLKIDFKKGNFYDKLIVSSSNKTYVLMPLFQEVKIFDNLDNAKEVCQKNLYTENIDEYYRE